MKWRGIHVSCNSLVSYVGKTQGKKRLKDEMPRLLEYEVAGTLAIDSEVTTSRGDLQL